MENVLNKEKQHWEKDNCEKCDWKIDWHYCLILKDISASCVALICNFVSLSRQRQVKSRDMPHDEASWYQAEAGNHVLNENLRDDINR